MLRSSEQGLVGERRREPYDKGKDKHFACECSIVLPFSHHGNLNRQRKGVSGREHGVLAVYDERGAAF